MSRYIIYGAGAVGGVIGARLALSGRKVLFIARGGNLKALSQDGLRLTTSREDITLDVDVVDSPEKAAITKEDRVILCVKTQDTTEALNALANAASPEVPIFCAQNGVTNEALALRFFEHVYGMHVFIVSTHLSPGSVQCYTDPSHGMLDLGRYPAGTDSLAEDVAADLVAAGFDTLAQRDIMRWKYGKLIMNCANMLHAACGDLKATAELEALARREAEECLAKAGIAYVPEGERHARIAAMFPLAHIDGKPFPGGSSWQSLTRKTGNIETDYLNGEIVRLGRMAGFATPINEYLQRLARNMLLEGMAAGTVPVQSIIDDLAANLETISVP